MYMLMLFISIIIVIFYVHKLWNYVSQLSHHDTYSGSNHTVWSLGLIFLQIIYLYLKIVSLKI